MAFPKSIQEMVGNRAYTQDKTGCSKAQILLFDDMVLKIERHCAEADTEVEMMEWLQGKLPVPRVLRFTREKGENYLLMSRLEGEMACSPTLLQKPCILTPLLAEALWLLQKIDVSRCPRKQLVVKKLALVQERVHRRLCRLDDAVLRDCEAQCFKTPEALLTWLLDKQPKEEAAFIHGDFCLPNLFLKDGKLSGFIDLGQSGVGDFYWDISLCYRSLRDNLNGVYGGKAYGGFQPAEFFKELGLQANFDKIRYYLLLDSLL